VWSEVCTSRGVYTVFLLQRYRVTAIESKRGVESVIVSMSTCLSRVGGAQACMGELGCVVSS
jgi:hypothetical protein